VLPAGPPVAATSRSLRTAFRPDLRRTRELATALDLGGEMALYLFESRRRRLRAELRQINSELTRYSFAFLPVKLGLAALGEYEPDPFRTDG
jgi:hypothetical protein